MLSKTNGKLVGDLMTPAPVVVRESTNLEDAARFSQSLSNIIVLLFSVLRLLANRFSCLRVVQDNTKRTYVLESEYFI